MPDAARDERGSSEGKPKEWWTCHHCDGVGCEVCEDEGGWFESLEEREARELLWATTGRPEA